MRIFDHLRNRGAAHTQEDLDDAAEAVFRQMFLEHETQVSPQARAQVYFISFSVADGVCLDPDEPFLERFADHHPPVRKVSQAQEVHRPEGDIHQDALWPDIRGGYLTDKQTGAKGIHYTICSWFFISPTEMNLSPSEITARYPVRKENGKWVVHTPTSPPGDPFCPLSGEEP